METEAESEKQLAVQAENVTVEFRFEEFAYTTLKETFIGWLDSKKRNQVKTFRALDGVNVSIRRGESVAFLGHNGSGKSTLLRVLAGIIELPDAKVVTNGLMAPLIELGAGFDGELSGRENIKLSCLLMGLKKDVIAERFDDIVAFAELEKFIDMPIKNYSSGMYARLGFACTTAVDPDILLVDEVLAVGDSNFAKKCYERIEQLRLAGTSVVLVSHDENVVQRFCERGLVLEQGKVIFDGPIRKATAVHRKTMRQRYLDSLPSDEREEVIRTEGMALSEEASLRGSDDFPVVTVRAHMTQNGDSVSDIDFSRSFEFLFDVHVLSGWDKIEGIPSFGIELVTEDKIRIWGCGSAKDSSVTAEFNENNRQVRVQFAFPEGLPSLCAKKYLIGFGMHDRQLTRTLFNAKLKEFEGYNSALGKNFDRNLVSLDGVPRQITVQPSL